MGKQSQRQMACCALINRWWKKAVGIAIGIFACVTLILSMIPNSIVQKSFSYLIDLVSNGGNATLLGGLLFVLLDILAIALALPGTPLNLAAGFIFNVWIGSLISVLGITLGAIVAFLLGRTLMRSWAQSKALAYPKLRALEKAMSENGFSLIFLLRLSPLMPFAICCYVLGATKVTFTVYSLASFLGLTPSTIAYCYLGTLMKDLSAIWSQGGENKTWKTVWIVVIGVTTLLLIAFVTHMTKKALDKAIVSEQQEQGLRLTDIQLDDLERGELNNNNTTTATIETNSQIDENNKKEEQQSIEIPRLTTIISSTSTSHLT